MSTDLGNKDENVLSKTCESSNEIFDALYGNENIDNSKTRRISRRLRREKLLRVSFYFDYIVFGVLVIVLSVFLLNKYDFFREVHAMSSLHTEANSQNITAVLPDRLSIPLENGSNIEFVKCLAGEFNMGSKESDPGHETNESYHKVKLTEDFYIGRYEVTQREFASIMKYNPSKNIGERLPVESVSWFEIRDFCKKMNALYKAYLPRGYIFALPSEAQWEYAYLAGTSSEDDLNLNLKSSGWYSENSKGSTHKVGEMEANSWKIYDMLGNVAEFCADNSVCLPGGDAVDPLSVMGNDTSHVVRGGSWRSEAKFCRSANRYFLRNDIGNDYVGFRLAVVAENKYSNCNNCYSEHSTLNL